MERGKLGQFGRYSVLCLLSLLAISQWSACNSHPVELVRASGTIDVVIPYNLSDSQKLDILWVIDNSGSMCQEQKMLRDNFDKFVNILGEINVDFHIGVTTTHMVTPDRYPLEPVARPGRLQTTPQPVPGYDTSCLHALDELGQEDKTRFDPVLENIRMAVRCTESPENHQHLLDPPNSRLRCAFYPQECTGDAVSRNDLFPPASAYRQFATPYLRFADYQREDGTLDVSRLRDDFACISMVGTQGYYFEQGLAASVRAMHPELTGGPNATDQTQFPNAGFLRPEARTGIIYVGDENDCSHDGTLDEHTTCGVAECSFHNRPGMTNSALIPVEDLKRDLMRNLSLSKGKQVSDEDVLVASIHGAHRVFDEERPLECPTGYDIPTSCRSPLGIAYSGDRFEEFIRLFPTFFPQPDPQAPESPLDGLICTDFGPALEDIASLFRGDALDCITNIYRCEGPQDWCPSFPFTDTPGTCTPYPQQNGFYCNSGIQVRLRLNNAGSETVSRLQNTGYCLPESVNRPEFQNGCVVNPARYRWIACPSGGDGVLLEWVDDGVGRTLSGFELQVRYAQTPPQ